MTVPTDFILIVDDNTDNLAVLGKTLKGAGHAVRVALDGESAIALVTAERPSLILLDVMMPGIDGFETCRRLKQTPIPLSVPVIFMTALADSDNKVKGLSLGAIDYIAKPFDEGEVLARVRIQLKMQNLVHTLQSQNQRLQQEMEQRQAAEMMLQQLNNELETRVKDRTAELHQALDDLNSAQVTLVQQEKLSTLGELMAGVAHEINNPNTFISGNISHVSNYTHQLLDLVRRYEQAVPNPSPSLQQAIADCDLDFVQQDLPRIVRSMQLGSDRIQELVRSFRNFSRLGESDKKVADLHEGINSTLVLLSYRLKSSTKRPEIEVVKHYGTLPKIECYPGRLNQVFMNILTNAIEALDGSSDPCIQIHTDVVEHSIVIRVVDNGSGIEPALQKQIFEPFFTTKPVGKNIGLGLTMGYQIVVVQHHGKLHYQSSEANGTEFTIEIPIQAETAVGLIES